MLSLYKKFVKVLPFTIRKRLPREIKVVEISKSESKSLNQKYYRKNRPANVLSFRYDKDYGEILVCPEVIRREAKEQGNAYKYQFTWMILHGMLHLAGMHHERSKTMADRMHRLEEELLKKIFK